MLQSDESRPDLFYSWAGGVMQAQAKAGFLQGHHRGVAPRRSDAVADRGRGVQGRRQESSACRSKIGEVAFFYNKKLFDKAGVKAEDIKTWDDFLGAVKKLKAAGITPIDRRRRREMADALLLFLSRHAHRRRRTRWPTPRPARTAASRTRPSSRPASACANSRRSSRSSPAISPPSTPNRPACSATARRRWI